MTEEDHDAFAAFHNRLRVMLNIEKDELVGAMALDEEDLDGWISFRENPWRFFIKAGTDVAENIWRIILQREYEASLSRATPLFTYLCAVCDDGSNFDAQDKETGCCPACGDNFMPF